MTTLNRAVVAAFIAASTIACVSRSSVETTFSTAAQQSTPVEELAAARNLWESSGPASYQFEIDGGGCECTLAGQYRITVTEGLSGAEEVEATNDTELGFPTAFRIVWNQQVDDGTFFATINLVNSAGT